MIGGLVASLVALCVFTGGVVGLLLNRILPAHHLTKETTDAVRLGTGMLSVLAALVLGLLIATARDSLETVERVVRGLSADLIQTDQVLGAYGPETTPTRDLLRRYAMAMLKDGWAQSDRDLIDADQPAGTALEQVRQAVLSLEPTNAAKHWLRDQALVSSSALLKARWELLERQGLPIRPAFVLVLTSWIASIFVSFGLNAPRNATVICTFAVCSFAIGTAMFLIFEMEAPFDGLIQVAKYPVEVALARMGR